jgi:hypothetical protein
MTTSGPHTIRCWSCGLGHATVVEVRHCHDERQAAEAEAAGEREAEYRNERWFEDRGAAEADAERAWEDSRGVVQFGDAMRIAEAGRF